MGIRVFSFGRRLGATGAILALGASSLVMAAGPSAASTSLTLEQDRADVNLRITQRLNRITSLNASATRSRDINSTQREQLVTTFADTIFQLSKLQNHVNADSTVDAVEADRAALLAIRANQVIYPRSVFIIRGMRVTNRLHVASKSLLAARSHTSRSADVQLTRAAAALASAAVLTRKAVTDASRILPSMAVDGATPFTAANKDWAGASAAVTKAQGYLDAAQKLDRTSPADTVIRFEANPATPIFDAP